MRDAAVLPSGTRSPPATGCLGRFRERSTAAAATANTAPYRRDIRQSSHRARAHSESRCFDQDSPTALDHNEPNRDEPAALAAAQRGAHPAARREPQAHRSSERADVIPTVIIETATADPRITPRCVVRAAPRGRRRRLSPSTVILVGSANSGPAEVVPLATRTRLPHRVSFERSRHPPDAHPALWWPERTKPTRRAGQ